MIFEIKLYISYRFDITQRTIYYRHYDEVYHITSDYSNESKDWKYWVKHRRITTIINPEKRKIYYQIQKHLKNENNISS